MTTTTSRDRFAAPYVSTVTTESSDDIRWKNCDRRSLTWRRMSYRTRLKTGDFLPLNRLYVGSKKHTQTMDLLSAIQSEDEEDLVRLVLHGWNQQSIAEEFGVHQTTIGRRLRRILRHAN